jgi:hypothetical protein
MSSKKRSTSSKPRIKGGEEPAENIAQGAGVEAVQAPESQSQSSKKKNEKKPPKDEEEQPEKAGVEKEDQTEHKEGASGLGDDAKSSATGKKGTVRSVVSSKKGSTIQTEGKSAATGPRESKAESMVHNGSEDAQDDKGGLEDRVVREKETNDKEDFDAYLREIKKELGEEMFGLID